MATYDKFAKFYDLVIGDRRSNVVLINKIMKKNNSKAKKILELACGTGAILKPLSRKYEVFGLDASGEMLKAAREKLPKAKLYKQNMVNFKVDDNFDVILCVFDSINHLLKFNEWEKVFKSAYNHLNKGGIFIFDMNTKKQFKRLTSQLPVIKEFNNNFNIIKITGTNTAATWHVKVFEYQKNDKYRLIKEDIKEKTFPIDRIKRSLKKIYRKVDVLDFSKDALRRGERLYFICKI